MPSKNKRYDDDEFLMDDEVVDTSTPIVEDNTQVTVEDSTVIDNDQEIPTDNPSEGDAVIGDQTVVPPTDETVTDPVITPDSEPNDTDTEIGNDGDTDAEIDSDNDGDSDPSTGDTNGDADNDAGDGDVNEPETKTEVDHSKKFVIKYGNTFDNRGSLAPLKMSAAEVVDAFVKNPICFIGTVSKSDCEELTSIIDSDKFTVHTKKDDYVEFSKAGKKRLIERIKEHSAYTVK